MKSILPLALAATLAATTACYRSDAPNCTVTCATAEDCPGSLTCTTNGLCASGGESCTGQVDGPLDADLNAIAVTVLDDHGVPAIGIRVIASAGGVLLDETTTANDGTATLAVTGVADVTVVRINGLGTNLTTIRDAAGGDALVFGRPRNEPTTVTREVTWPVAPSAFRYVVFSSCPAVGAGVAIVPVGGGTTESTDLTLDASCAGDHDLLVTFSDSALINRGYQIVTGVSADVTFTGSWTAFGFDTDTSNFQQLPAAVGSFLFAGTNVFRAGDPARGYSTFQSVTGGGPAASAELALPPIGVARDLVLGARHDGDGRRIQQIAARVPVTGQYNLAVEPAMVPWMTSLPTLDLITRAVSWTQESAGATATDGELVAIQVDYDRPGTDVRWRIIAPVTALTTGPAADRRTLALPDLPGDEVFEPRATDNVGPVWARTYGFGGGVGYDLARLRADVAIADAVDPYVVVDTFLADPAILWVVSSRREP